MQILSLVSDYFSSFNNSMEGEKSKPESLDLHSDSEDDLKLVRNSRSLYEIAEVSPKGHYKRVTYI